MSFVPSGRVGLSTEVSGFVTSEPKTLAVRLRRLSDEARRQMSGMQERFHAPVQSATPAAIADPAPMPVEAMPALHQAASDAVSAPKFRGWRIHAAAGLIRGRQLGVLALAALRPLERLRDMAALAGPVVLWCLRMAWRAPRWLQVIAVVGIGLSLAPWPESDEAEAATVPVEAAAPVQGKVADPWRLVPGVIPAYNLEAPELDRSAPKYSARRHIDGTRQDMISWHEDAGEDVQRPRNRFSGALAVEQPARDGIRPETMFVDMARRAALVGASIERMSDPFVLHNKFGALDVADVTISNGTDTRACLAFRHAPQAGAIRFYGWFCGAAQRPLDRRTLACLLDRIDLIGGGDQRVRAFFAGAERARLACGTYQAAKLPAGWVDSAGRIPELKTSFRDVPRR